MRIRFLDIKINGQTLVEFALIMPILVLMMYFTYHLHTVINTGMNGHIKQRTAVMRKMATNGTSYKPETISDVTVKIKDHETKEKKDVTLSPVKIEFNVKDYTGKKAMDEENLNGQNGVSGVIMEYYRNE